MIRKFMRDESGQGMVEYILIIAAIALVVVVGMRVFGNTIKGLFGVAGAKVTSEVMK